MPLDQEQPTSLYRLFDEAGRLLYVGIAFDPEQRLKSHASTAPWWPLVVRRKIVQYPDRGSAECAETRAIKAESPLYNRAQSETPANLTLDFADFTDVPVGQLRIRMADVVQAAAVRGRITYITSHGRRVAAVVPVLEAEAIEERRRAESSES